jgi:effector-binding domain-containing protein
MTEIEIIEVPEQPTAAVREQVAIAALSDFFGRAFGLVAAELDRQGVTPAGPPFGYYHGAPGETVDVEAGIPVGVGIRPAGEVVPSRLPACRAARAVHVGPYDTLELTYAAVREFAEAEGAELADDMWESYLSDPSCEPDPAHWCTLLTRPLV